jgi:DNA replication protein DnaC
VWRELRIGGKCEWPLTLHGDVGTGKTCAALALCDWTLNNLCFSARQFAEDFRRAEQGLLTWYREGAGGKISPHDLWTHIRKVDLVVIDELGAREKVPQTHYDAILRLLDIRLKAPLIFVSNLNMEELAEVYDYRVVDRLLAGTVLCVKGESRRRKNEASA